MRLRTSALVVAAFAMGSIAGFAAAPKRVIDPALYAGKDPKEAAAALVPIARQIAEDGSWENIFIGRVLYLGGHKAEGQKIFDEVAARKKVAGSDWFRIGKVYYEAGEWDKAQAAFDKALQLSPEDEDWLAEVGAYYNLKGDRKKAEEFFAHSFKLDSNDVWNTAKVAGSYVGVVPQ